MGHRLPQLLNVPFPRSNRPAGSGDGLSCHSCWMLCAKGGVELLKLLVALHQGITGCWILGTPPPVAAAGTGWAATAAACSECGDLLSVFRSDQESKGCYGMT
ncbi:hypothetical protein DUNSADRAFT_9378 [Dunaliella salina]|uniref:Encoded protein n=1 Tax=Dunaliella salina TaxID=3046 RepID=A0ABQ7GHL9_DUNSA|nr:hypothetical protein DUNSADRAFT_9378 [Dunaliella salina]|eukprot:KAF5834101.1 hypothetical protein DUNSADRAFT_9378 [Dunaliella salina]